MNWRKWWGRAVRAVGTRYTATSRRLSTLSWGERPAWDVTASWGQIAPLESRQLLSATPVGNEFQVNTVTTGQQGSAAIAMDADGDFVVTWNSRGQDGSDYGIYGQRYNAAGVAQGAEFAINTDSSGRKLRPVIAMDDDGDFVVTWDSGDFVGNGQDGSRFGIFGQRFNAMGVAQGAEFQVNTYTTGSQYSAAIAMDADGDFVITWTGEGLTDDDAIYGQRYNATGVPQGTEFRVNSYTTSDQRVPAVAMDDVGNFVVTWDSLNQDHSANGIFAQCYDAAGNPQGSEFRVNSYTIGGQSLPAIAVEANGDGVVAWSGQGATDFGIFAQRFLVGTPPIDLALSSTTIPENQLIGTVVGTLSATDSDFPETFTYELVSGEGDGDNGRFAISGSQLVTAERFDFEVAKKFGVRVRVTDSHGLSFEKKLTIFVSNIMLAVDRVEVAGDAVTENERLISRPDTLTVKFTDNIITVGEGRAENPAHWMLTKNGVDISDQIASINYGFNAVTNTDDAVLRLFDPLLPGDYKLTARDTLTDLLAVPLDGDDNGLPGADFVRNFTVRSPQPMGAEFRVNTFTTGGQVTNHVGAVATKSDGDFVVTWTSYGQDGNVGTDGSIYAQRYNAQGIAQGSEFRVNTENKGNQHHAAVAIDAVGNFVITWTSDDQDLEDLAGIYARRFDAAGTPLGDEFLVNTFTTGDQVHSTVAMDADGDFVITWASHDQDGSGFGIFGKRYNSQGVSLFGEFQVNTITKGDQITPTVAMDADGRFVVAWESFSVESGYTVFAREYSATGAAQLPEFQVNTYTTGERHLPTVAMDADGDYVVTWSSEGLDGDGFGVYAQLYDNVTGKFLNEFRVNTTTTADQRDSTVSMDADGDFVVTWTSLNQDGSLKGIFARQFDGYGKAQGDEFQVNTFTNGQQYFSSVALDADGDYVVVWTSDLQDGSGAGVYAQRYQVGTAPTEIILTNNTLPENQPVGTTVGILLAVDGDGPESFTYALVSGLGGTDNARFAISGNQLLSAESFDFELRNSFSIRVRVTDAGGLSFEKQFQISVSDLNERAVYIVDDGDVDFAVNGTWGTINQGYKHATDAQRDMRSSNSPNRGTDATWTFAGLETGTYRVSTTWVANRRNSTNALYTVESAGVNSISTSIKQTGMPDDLINIDGGNWEDLGYITIVANSLTVRLSGAGNGTTWADAVRISREVPLAPEISVRVLGNNLPYLGNVDLGSTLVGSALPRIFEITNSGNAVLTLGAISVPSGFAVIPPALASLNPGQSTVFTLIMTGASPGAISGTVSIVTNDTDENPFRFTVTGTVKQPLRSLVIINDTPVNNSEFATTGNWGTFNQGRGGDMRLSQTAGNTATWTFTNLEPGTYRVSTTWIQNRRNSTQAQYHVTGGVAPVTAVLDQTTTPALNLTGDGTFWSDISNSVVLVGNTLTVTLTALNGDPTWADAIRVERIA